MGTQAETACMTGENDSSWIGTAPRWPPSSGMRGFFSAKYCYRFFFYYLTAYLRALIETENADARATLPWEMAEFLIGCWINARMNAADDAAKQLN